MKTHGDLPYSEIWKERDVPTEHAHEERLSVMSSQGHGVQDRGVAEAEEDRKRSRE